MTEVQQKPALAGALGTIAVWILIFLFFYFGASLFAPKPFKTIKIRLDAPTKTESVKKVESGKLKTESSQPQKTESTQTQKNVAQGEVSPSLQPASQSSATPSAGTPRNAPSTQKTDSKPKTDSKKTSQKNKQQEKTSQKTNTKTDKKNAARKQNAPVEPPQVPLAPDLTNGDFFNQPKTKKVLTDEEIQAMFEAQEGNSSSPDKPNVISPIKPVTELSGKSATQSQEDNGVNVKSNLQKQVNGDASGETKKNLADISDAKPTQYSSKGGEISVKVATGDGKTFLETRDGQKRELIDPKVPKLDLSESAQNVAINYPVGPYSISFTILPNGVVEFSSIKLPNSLPLEIQTELKNQLKDWRFSPADYRGTVDFNYSMKRK